MYAAPPAESDPRTIRNGRMRSSLFHWRRSGDRRSALFSAGSPTNVGGSTRSRRKNCGGRSKRGTSRAGGGGTKSVGLLSQSSVSGRRNRCPPVVSGKGVLPGCPDAQVVAARREKRRKEVLIVCFHLFPGGAGTRRKKWSTPRRQCTPPGMQNQTGAVTPDSGPFRAG